MRLLFNLVSVFALAAKRLWNQLGLMLCIAIGFVVAVALVMSIPLYSDAVNHKLLQSELLKDQSRPPFAFLYQYVGAWNGPIEWTAYHPADEQMRMQTPGIIGLPLQQIVRHVKTDKLRLFPASEADYANIRNPLEWINVGFVSQIENHIELTEGRFPEPAGADQRAFEVLVQEELANRLGLQIGEQYVLFGGQKEGGENRPAQLRARISGIWRPLDPREPFWFYQSKAFENTFLIPEATFVNYIVPEVKNEVHLAVWYLVFDGQGIHTEDVEPLLGRIIVANKRASDMLSALELASSPLSTLLQYRRAVFLLSILLYVFALPIVSLVLYFIGLISSMVVQHQRQEIAVLRSRGTSSIQVLAVYLLEGSILGALALGVGYFAARTLAQIMANTRSFLSFTPRAALPIRFSLQSLRLGGTAVGLALAASLLPAFSASGHTIVTYKQEIARALRRPFWQRYFVDFLLLVPPLYGYYMLRQRGTISVLGQELTHGSDPFQNPLLFLVPTLFLFALALLFIRLFPPLMRIMARLVAGLPGASSILAFRHLARSTGDYTGPLLLIVLTISLAAFTASMAKTLDSHLIDRVYYQVGADMRLIEAGGSGQEEEADEQTPGKPQLATSKKEEESGARWLFLPVSEHLTIPGVKAAARLGNYMAIALVPGTMVEGHLLGIDRVDFLQAGFFRRDFAPDSLGALMNALAVQDDALLVSRQILDDYALRVGDRLKLRLMAYSNESKDILFTIAGGLDYFPTVYPDNGPFFVSNLEYLFQELGGQYPYDVLLATDGRDAQEIVKGVEDLGMHVISSFDSRGLVDREQAKPEQGGTFGLLSIGFITAAALTALGFLLYSVLSFRERFIELGVLRAIGLSISQMAAFLAIEQMVLIVAGVGVGTGLGVWASRLFVPYFQVRGDLHPQTPPFVVQIAWGDIFRVYAIFGGLLVLAIAAMISLLIRMKIFQAVKLGDVA